MAIAIISIDIIFRIYFIYIEQNKLVRYYICIYAFNFIYEIRINNYSV